jgi:hypothetical protein
LQDLKRPGPRREKEGRGGATADTTVLRWLTRCPLPAAGRLGRRDTQAAHRAPAAVLNLFGVFYLLAARKIAGADKLDRTLEDCWALVREEFWFEHQVLLPDAKANGDVPG